MFLGTDKILQNKAFTSSFIPFHYNIYDSLSTFALVLLASMGQRVQLPHNIVLFITICDSVWHIRSNCNGIYSCLEVCKIMLQIVIIVRHSL